MNIAYIHALQSEWLKQRRSLSAWLVIAGGFFVPLLMLAARLYDHEGLPSMYASGMFWTLTWGHAWEFSAMFLLPMGTVFASSLITQIEHRNNAWKQVHALPLSLPTIYAAKLTIVIAMLLQYLLLFNIGVALVVLVPVALVPGVSMPAAAFPLTTFLRHDLLFFLGCLPIVALQYLLGLRFRNFMVPIGAGFALWVLSMMTLGWKWGWLLPYRYTLHTYLANVGHGNIPPSRIDDPWMSLAWFALFALAGYGLFATARQKG